LCLYNSVPSPHEVRGKARMGGFAAGPPILTFPLAKRGEGINPRRKQLFMNPTHWAVIGAGPAGIAAVAKLLDHGIPEDQILWIDPQFSIGDFGSHWKNVPSNTKVDRFLQFLEASDAFKIKTCPMDFELFHLPKDDTCYLHHMVEPLKWITHHLKNTVKTITADVTKLHLNQRTWCITVNGEEKRAQNVILAIGATPKRLSYDTDSIPLQEALDPERLKNQVKGNETIGVFGSSHSAILVVRNLIEHTECRIINFYRSPLVYAVYFDDWIMFDDTGLKGNTADWAREHLDGKLSHRMQRVYSNDHAITTYLPLSDKVVYAVGFERRPLLIEGLEGHIHPTGGILAPGLFGFGIAFPERQVNRLGLSESRVGLWKFMEYLQRVLPIWMCYPL
jgi:hypothetical protein